MNYTDIGAMQLSAILEIFFIFKMEVSCINALVIQKEESRKLKVKTISLLANGEGGQCPLGRAGVLSR